MSTEESKANGVPSSVLVALAALSCAVPIWSTHYLPFCDLPEHVGAASVIAHYGDPSWGFGQTFELAFGTSQYLLYHLLVALFVRVMNDAELANRVVLGVFAFAFPYALRSLLRALGRDERLAVFAPLAFWSRPLFWGFLPYVASIPVLAYCIARHER